MLCLLFLQNSCPAFSPSTSSPNPMLLYAPPYQLPQRLDPRHNKLFLKPDPDALPSLCLLFLQNSCPAFSPSTVSPNPTLLYAPPYQLPQRLDPRQTNSKASKDTISTDSSIKTHHTHKPEVDVLKKQRKKNASSEQTSMCSSGVFSFLFFTSPTRCGLMF